MNISKLYFMPVVLVLSACAPVQQEDRLPFSPSFAVDGPAWPYKNDTVYFAAQSSELNAEDHKKLMAIATTMRMNKTLRARLTGSAEHETKNPSLALRRAIAVRNILSQMGVSPNRILVKDETHTDTILSQQHTESGDDANDRRVDIVLESVTGQAI
jgi:outer membrane protein OmpA-like peptidoglycan-associated protein